MMLRVLKDQQRIKVIITDNGKGIASDKLPHIFERLYQCDNSRSTKGNGLGLAITKELVNAHKGTITANSILIMEQNLSYHFQKLCKNAELSFVKAR